MGNLVYLGLWGKKCIFLLLLSLLRSPVPSGLLSDFRSIPSSTVHSHFETAGMVPFTKFFFLAYVLPK